MLGGGSAGVEEWLGVVYCVRKVGIGARMGSEYYGSVWMDLEGVGIGRKVMEGYG